MLRIDINEYRKYYFLMKQDLHIFAKNYKVEYVIFTGLSHFTVYVYSSFII